MKRLISCEFNMDTNCVELVYTDGTVIAMSAVNAPAMTANTITNSHVIRMPPKILCSKTDSFPERQNHTVAALAC